MLANDDLTCQAIKELEEILEKQKKQKRNRIAKNCTNHDIPCFYEGTCTVSDEQALLRCKQVLNSLR